MTLKQRMAQAFGTAAASDANDTRIHAKDFMSPASIITIAGLLVCIAGSFYLDQWLGLILIAIGRAFDLIDGPVARATKVTHLSLILDPIADKLALAAILIGCWRFALIPLTILVYIVAVHAFISMVSIIAERRGTATGAAIPGKLHLFLHNIALVLFVLAPLFADGYEAILVTAAYIAITTSVPLAVLTIRSYLHQIR